MLSAKCCIAAAIPSTINESREWGPNLSVSPASAHGRKPTRSLLQYRGMELAEDIPEGTAKKPSKTEEHDVRRSVSEQDTNRSLDDLQRWPESQTWHILAGTTSSSSPPESSNAEQPSEQVILFPENIALPKTTKPQPIGFMQWAAGVSKRVKREPQREQLAPQRLPLQVEPEVLIYRDNIDLLAAHFPNLSNIADTTTRHGWSPRIVFYDRTESAPSNVPKRYEPWKTRLSAPLYEEFHGMLRDVSDDCVQRTILIEDLTPSLIDLLGATFMIPPHVFEEHLDRSGYRMVPEDRDIPVTWHARSSTQGYSSITWYRPVLPLIPINPRFRNRLISNRIPTVRCFFRDCGRHDLRLRTLGNIWRRPLDICPEPGIHYKNSSTEYPVAWEERVTMWTQDFDGCKFVVILLDPLPIVVDEISGAVQRRIRREEGVSQAPDRSQARQIDDWIPPPPPLPPSPPPLSSALASSATSPSLPPPPPPPLLPLPLSTGVVSSQTPKSQASTTGARVESPEDEFVPATLRRRATQAFMENYPTPNGGEGAETRTQQGRRFSVGVPQPVFPESDQETRIVDDHGPFVPYHPIRTRSSSFAVSGHDTTALDARTYIESLQVPTSTLDEFEYLIQLHTKGKEVAHDSFHPLLRAIHDDTLSLVGIIRVTLRRIREGTLDEDLMQRRILFWRTLLYRLSFSLAELDGQLREFKQFSSDSTFGSRSELPSEKLAKDTQQALRSCMDLIDKSSDSLRAEMQIVDSRRSIAEAESVSKLTELAFVFIPLSFVASLFSMQIRELDGGVRLYQFVLVAMAFVLVAYTVRLSIRSSRIIEYKNKTFKQIREAAQLQYNDPIPTRIFLIWIGMAMSKSVYKMTRTSIAILTPTVLILAAIAAILSPVILLWVRGINRGFSAVITVILLLLDVLLLYPVVTNSAGEIDFNPRTMVRNIQRSRRIVRKQKKKARAKRRQKQGLDPEFGGADDSSSSSSTSTRRVSTRVSIITET